MEIIILAGGIGSRLSSVVYDSPKCMADINGKPFLHYLLEYLEEQGAHHVILSLGYMHQSVLDWVHTRAFTFKLSWVIEKTALGTGGAIKLAMNKAKNNKICVINGDTYFPIELEEAFATDINGIKGLLCLKEMNSPDRYGTVALDENGFITAFEEKKIIDKGLINAGTYILNREHIDWSQFPESFSLEKDFLEKNTNGQLKGKVFDNYFIDIGIPEDYTAFINRQQ